MPKKKKKKITIKPKYHTGTMQNFETHLILRENYINLDFDMGYRNLKFNKFQI